MFPTGPGYDAPQPSAADFPRKTKELPAVTSQMTPSPSETCSPSSSAYADGATLDRLAETWRRVFAKVPPVRISRGYSKDQFAIDPHAGTATGPAHGSHPRSARRRCGGPVHAVVRRMPAGSA
jgi:hypothetical protein